MISWSDLRWKWPNLKLSWSKIDLTKESPVRVNSRQVSFRLNWMQVRPGQNAPVPIFSYDTKLSIFQNEACFWREYYDAPEVHTIKVKNKHVEVDKATLNFQCELKTSTESMWRKLIKILFRYAKKIKLLSDRYRDQPLTPLETAIYWTEYVARHQGAPHLHSAGLDLNFFAYHSLDVFAAYFVGLYLVWRLIKLLFRRIVCRKWSKCSKNIEVDKKTK